MAESDDLRAKFMEAACVPLDAGHASGTLEHANALLAANPDLARGDIFTAAILGDDATVVKFLEHDTAGTTATGGPRGWDALTYLCFSRYLRLDRARSDGFVRAATALLEAGASANTGWFERDHEPEPEWESALYGAAGVAHHAPMTRLLLAHGAEPNDNETPYHAPEGWDNDALGELLLSGKLNDDSLATMLLRKTDWHDGAGVKLLLEHGADPNRTTHWGKTALHNALLSDNALPIIESLVDRGADPTLVASKPDRWTVNQPGLSAVALAARRGRGDVLTLFESRGIPVKMHGVDHLLAACARNDAEAVRSVVASEPQVVVESLAQSGQWLAQFAGIGNTEGIRQLLDLGVPVDAVFADGDDYFEIAKGSTALHVAAWRARHATVNLLIERGATVDARDGKGRTPLMLAVRACVDSYWSDRRSPESVQALLGAGASASGVAYPSGYAEVDALLQPRSDKSL